MVVIEIPKRHSSEVIQWLHEHVSPNQPYRMPDLERTDESQLNPNWVSTTAQRARWQGQHGLWQVEQRGNLPQVRVICRDIRLETYIMTRWGQ